MEESNDTIVAAAASIKDQTLTSTWKKWFADLLSVRSLVIMRMHSQRLPILFLHIYPMRIRSIKIGLTEIWPSNLSVYLGSALSVMT